MATVKAFIRTTKKNKPANVRFRLSDGRGIQLFHKSDFLVSPDVWDSGKERIKAKILYKEKDRIEFNNKVNERKTLIQSLYDKEPNKEKCTTEWLEEAIDKSLNPEKYNLHLEIKTLLIFVRHFIETAPTRKDKKSGKLLSVATIKQYKVAEKHLTSFARYSKKTDFHFDQIDQTFYDEYVAYLQKEIPQTDKKGQTIKDDNGKPILIKESFTANNVGKNIKLLKTMLNEATLQGHNAVSTYNSFRAFSEDADTVYLSEAELQTLKEHDFTDSLYLDRVRDWFLLLAWTGCRFSDLEKVGKTDIQNGFISFRQQKTNTKVTIPLHPVVVEILEKYDYDLPRAITNQKFNEYIKDVAKAAGINSKETITVTKGGKIEAQTMEKWELISSHTGRRSFCTNMYKRGLPTLMIMSISGHKTEKSFLKYIKVKQSEHAEMMKKAWKNMYK